MCNSPSKQVTLIEAISLTRSSGDLRLSVNTFKRFLAAGAAPKAVARRHGEPLWDRQEITEWSRERLQALLEDDTRRLLRALHRDAAHQTTPNLTCMDLDTTLPTHHAIVLAEERLIRLLADIRRDHNAQCARLARLTTHSDGNEAPRRSRKRWPVRRRIYASDPTTLARAAIVRLDSMEELARADLGTCRAWLHNMLGWAEAEGAARRRTALEEQQLMDEERERALALDDLRYYASGQAFADEDEARLSSALRGSVRKASLALGGMDFGYHWRQDDTDDLFSGPQRARTGTWRVSWLEHSGELYAWSRLTDQVVLIGAVRARSFEMIEWLGPLEGRQSERNSLALVFEAYEAQRRAGFPAFEPDP
ncbi:hypothetical protein [Cellulomonas sp. URHB0016]